MTTRMTACLMAVTILVSACNNNAEKKSADTDTKKDSVNIKDETVMYSSDSSNMDGYIAYDTSKQGKRPVVLVLPEWWGVTDYPKMRARKLAELGYFAMVVDMYGKGKIAENPTEAVNMSSPFYKNPQMAFQRIMAAEQKAKAYPQADTSQIAAIGYCFGGGMVLNAAKLGADFKGVVSFHGSLAGVPAKKDMLKASILVCHGEKDAFVSQKDVDAFKKSMDSIHADFTFKAYPNATHAFTNPDANTYATKFNMPIAYNPAADSASWNDMKTFFGKIFKD